VGAGNAPIDGYGQLQNVKGKASVFSGQWFPIARPPAKL
jgi:hypothetical protein